MDLKESNEQPARYARGEVPSGQLLMEYGAPGYGFDPVRKLWEALEANQQLYERLLQAEKEKLAFLEKTMER